MECQDGRAGAAEVGGGDMSDTVVRLGPTIRLFPMCDHYAIIAGDRLVGVVTHCQGEADRHLWAVRLIEGRCSEPCSYVTLDYALKAAASWSAT